ncbi:MAG: hypothetical protein M3462_11770 [Chloroflexota bacterium]|nr:hypothetical protein [Chloroflexota bacterium]
MVTSVTVRDETLGEITGELTLGFMTERVTARELIRSRVYQEVTEYNARQGGVFRGLVRPHDAERTREGFLLHCHRLINWTEQYESAVAAIEKTGFLILVDDRQITDLGTEIEIRHDAAVSFLRLVPLIGG